MWPETDTYKNFGWQFQHFIYKQRGWCEQSKNTSISSIKLKFDYASIQYVNLRPFEAGIAWILLRNIISAFYTENYPWRIFQIEYRTDIPGFHKSAQDKMTKFVMALAGVNRIFRATLSAKCVYRLHEWDFIPGCIDPPVLSNRMVHVKKQPTLHNNLPYDWFFFQGRHYYQYKT